MDDTISMITITVLAASALYLLFLVASRAANYKAVTIELAKQREVGKELAAHNSYQEAQVQFLRKALDEAFNAEAEIQEG